MLKITFEGGFIKVFTSYFVEHLQMQEMDKLIKDMKRMPDDAVYDMVLEIDEQIINSAASGAIGPRRMHSIVTRLQRLGYHEGWTAEDCAIVCEKLTKEKGGNHD